MFQYFPKIQYGFSGGTFEATNIFKTINVVFDQDSIATTTKLPGERPDQVSYRLYETPQYFWSLFLVNGVRNPLREWAQTQESFTTQIESEYAGWVYQFANNSIFLPVDGSTGFGGDFLDRYNGVDLSNIEVGDLVIYETGSGPYSIKCYGAGGITSDEQCGSPQFGQCLIPDNFDDQQNVKQISSGNYFSTVLDTKGYIYSWGKDISLPSTSFNTFDRLYKSVVGGYTHIDAAGSKIVAVKDGTLSCFGTCTDFPTGQTDIRKTAWFTGGTAGVALKTDGTVVYFGMTGPTGITMYDISCGDNYCIGIVSSNRGLTAWGNNTYNQRNVPGITGVTAIAAGYRHALALHTNGTIYSWGSNSDGQTDISPTTSYIAISAGRSHSAAISTQGELSIWGKITYYGESGCAGQTTTTVTPETMSGVFSDINSGYDHIMLKGSGTNNKYIGVVDRVDDLYKRIYVKVYQFPGTEQVLLDDPSGTVVSIWRYNTNTQDYTEVKTIQNKLLTIQKYLDSTKYVNIDGNLLDPTSSSWESVYLPGHQTPESDERFITLRKELLDIDLYNKTQIKKLSIEGVKKLETSLKQIVADNNTTNIINITSL